MIAAVLLAAGAARRFGGAQKLLAAVPHEGGSIPLVRLAVLGLIGDGVSRIVVVGGREAGMVRHALDGIDVEFVENTAYESGMGSSLKTGVESAMRRWPESDGVLIALGDQPLGGKGIVDALVRQFEQSSREEASAAIVAPRFQGVMTTPVLFRRVLVSELLALTGDRGARAIVEREPSRVRYVDFDRPPPPDVDTIVDLAALSAERGKHQ